MQSGSRQLHALTRLQEPEEGLLCLSLLRGCLILASCGQQPVYKLAPSQHHQDLRVVWALRPSHGLLCKGHSEEVPWTAEAGFGPGTDALINRGLGHSCRSPSLVQAAAWHLVMQPTRRTFWQQCWRSRLDAAGQGLQQAGHGSPGFNESIRRSIESALDTVQNIRAGRTVCDGKWW